LANISIKIPAVLDEGLFAYLSVFSTIRSKKHSDINKRVSIKQYGVS
jgi:hypothetical protein